jgi:predicted DNA-binding transcriptional regulator YafY
MPNSSQTHPHSDRQAFERLMLLIATFLKYPSVGSPEEASQNDDQHHDALVDVKQKLEQLAQDLGITINSSIPTIRKDLVTLRKYGILNKRIYRWGYYLGTGAMTKQELSVALNALASLAEYQRSPQIIKIYTSLVKRLQGFDAEENSKLLYPVRSQINHLIVNTDLEDRIKKKQTQNRHTLFDSLTTVEKAILNGQAIEIYRHTDPYAENIGAATVYPLQLIYHDIAWYLLYENCRNSHFMIVRVDRLTDKCVEIPSQTRSLQAQKQSLDLAHQLLANGWGLNMGELEEQMQERQMELEFETVRVRFFAPVIQFIEEGTYRHPSQKIDARQKPNSIDLQLTLPPRSLSEFSRWVNRFMDNALVLAPEHLAIRHSQAAQRIIELYRGNSISISGQ